MVVYTHDAWNDYKPIVFPDQVPPPQVHNIENLRKKNAGTIAEIDEKRQSLLRKKIQRYDRELEISPQSAILHNSLGIVYGKFSMVSPDYLKKSESHFKKAMLLEDSLPAPRTNLGNVLILRSAGEKELNEAEDMYEEAIQRGETAGVYVNKMILHIIQGNRQKVSQSLSMALHSYTFEEIQTILGQSMEDYGMAKASGDENTSKIWELIQSLLRKLKEAEPDQEIRPLPKLDVVGMNDEPEDTGKSLEPSSSRAADIDRIMGELKDLLGDAVPRKPDEPINPGGVRGAMAQLGNFPLLLYWSDMQID